MVLQVLIKPPRDKYVSQLPELKLPFSTVVLDLMSFQGWLMIDGILLGSNLGLECAQALCGTWPTVFTDFGFLDILGILTLFTPIQLPSSPTLCTCMHTQELSHHTHTPQTNQWIFPTSCQRT